MTLGGVRKKFLRGFKKHPLHLFERCPASTSNPDFDQERPYGAHNPHSHQTNTTLKIQTLHLMEKAGQTGVNFLNCSKKLFVCIYSGLEYKVWDHFNKIVPVDFALAKDPHINNLHTDIFLNHFLRTSWRIFPSPLKT